MAAEIKPFPNTPAQTWSRPTEPQPEVIALLETLLEKARSGNLQAIAVATVEDVANVGEGWKPGNTVYSHQLMASISDLAYRYARRRHLGTDE